MKKKTLLSMLVISMLVITMLLWYQGVFAEDNPKVNPTTIGFNSGATMSSSPGTVTKQEHCAMSDHDGNSSCGTETPSDHPISTKWDPSDRKVTITIQADVKGYGQARASITSGSAHNATIHNFGGDIYDVGSWGGGTITGEASADPTEYTAMHKVYFYSPADAKPATYKWKASGGVDLWGVDWEGSGTVEVTATVGVELGLSPAGTYTVGVGIAESVSDDVSSNASFRLIPEQSGEWTVANDLVCGHAQCGESLTDPHAHHYWCPGSDGAICNTHIKCRDYIPDLHVSHKDCWNEKFGCEEKDVMKCTHECEHEPVRCNGCGEDVATNNEHFKTCGSEVPGATAGCGMKYFICQDSHHHDVLMCGNFSYFIENFCGDLYRRCTNPGFPRGGCHYNTAHAYGVEVCLPGCFGSSCAACDGDPSTTY